jgi:hypothetical protein
MSAFWEARRGRRTKKKVVRYVYAFFAIFASHAKPT